MPTTQPTLSKRRFVADSLMTGMLVMLLLSVVQRGVGFLRGIWFCQLLDDRVLGEWAMAQGFVTLVTPMMLLGLPGSLPRFVEHYRLRGNLGQYLGRLMLATAGCAALFLLVMLAFPTTVAWFVFLQITSNVSLIYALVIAVITMISFNFVNDLVASLRLVRMVSIMQFVQSILFTILAVLAILTNQGLLGLVMSFAIANAMAMFPGVWVLRRSWQETPVSESVTFDSMAMWRRLIPYAAAIWLVNVIGNMFELSDRYMLLHLMPGDEQTRQAAVGQYHSGRIFPSLLMSVTTMIAGVLMPYLAADWEAGRRQEVQHRMRRSLMLVTIGFTLFAALTQIASPLIFDELLRGRYNGGLSVMPLAFIFTIWSSLVIVGQNYLSVVEKGKWMAVSLAVGLIVNLGLNAMFVPTWGLFGAVVATAIANLVVLVGMWWSIHHFGCGLGHSAIICTFLPATIVCGPWVAIVFVACVSVLNADVVEIVSSMRDKWRARSLPVNLAG